MVPPKLGALLNINPNNMLHNNFVKQENKIIIMLLIIVIRSQENKIINVRDIFIL